MGASTVSVQRLPTQCPASSIQPPSIQHLFSSMPPWPSIPSFHPLPPSSNLFRGTVRRSHLTSDSLATLAVRGESTSTVCFDTPLDHCEPDVGLWFPAERAPVSPSSNTANSKHAQPATCKPH